MIAKENLEKRLERLAQAVSPDKSILDDVMLKIDRLPAEPAISREQTDTSHVRTWRKIMNIRFIKYPVAAAILIGAVGLLAWLTTGNGGANIAFADVLEEIRNFRPYSCTVH